MVAAVPTALATIKSAKSLRDELPDATASGSSPRGHGEIPSSRVAAEESSPNVDALLQKIPQEYRSDIARMLLASQERHALGYRLSATFLQRGHLSNLVMILR